MKHSYLLVLLLTLLAIGSKAQEYKYVPLADSNAVWSEKYLKWNVANQNYDTYYNKFAITGEDTLMRNKLYKKLYYFTGNTFNKDSAICFGGLREDSLKRVYIKSDSSLASAINPKPKGTQNEVALYDFSLQVGDTLDNGFMDQAAVSAFLYMVKISAIDTITINNTQRRRFHFSTRGGNNLNTLKWVEGIGSINSGLYYFDVDEFITGIETDENKLLCLTQNNQSVYVADGVKNCFPVTGLTDVYKVVSSATIFPNPTNTAFTVSVTNSSVKSVKLYNITGQLVLEQNTTTPHQTEVHIDVTSLNIGLYHCVMELSDGSISTQRIVKE